MTQARVLRNIAVRVWLESLDDDVFGQAAQLSYYFLLAIFPFLLFLTTLLGLLAHTGSEVYENLLSYAREMLPYTAFQLVNDTLKQIQSGAGRGKLSFGILATIWAAANGMSAMIDGLNRVDELKETRPWWKSKIISLVLTVLLSAFLIVSITLVLYGSRLADIIAGYFGLQAEFTAAWNFLQWPAVFLFVFGAFLVLYRFAPAGKRKSWRQVVPGALTGLLLWLLVSLLFRLYLQFFNSYNATYGSLGAVIVLMLWLYLSGATILLGAELNSELARRRRLLLAKRADGGETHLPQSGNRAGN